MALSIKDKLPDNAVESSASFYYIEDNNIIHIINKPKALHNKQDAIENVELLRILSEGIPHLLLIDVTHIKSMTRESREVYAKEGVPHRVKAVALVTKSTLGQIVGNFFIGFNRPEVPTKLFNSNSQARMWLEGLK